MVHCGPDTLLVVGGVPGAGKTTLIRRVFAGSAATVLDTDDVRERVQSRLRTRRGYGLYRPLIHAAHWLRIGAALRRGGPVVVHETATRRLSRRLLSAWARRHGLTPHLLLVDVDAGEALDGQRARGRRVRSASMRRHLRRWAALRAQLTAAPAGAAVDGYESAVVVPRPRLAAVEKSPSILGYAYRDRSRRLPGHEQPGRVLVPPRQPAPRRRIAAGGG